MRELSQIVVFLVFVAAAKTVAVVTAQTVRPEATTVVARATQDQPFDEPSLAVDPSDSNHLLAAIMVRGSAPTFPEVLKDQFCASFLSSDGGKTWVRHDFPVTACGDPWVVVTDDGQAVASMIGASPLFPNQGDSGLIIFHSKDGGRTWDDTPVGLGRGHDHTVMTIDRSASPRHGWIYVTSHRSVRADDGLRRFGPWVARSRDAGKSFDDPVSIIPNNVHNLTEMPVVLSDGTLVISFVDASYPSETDREGTFERRRAWVVRSADGGRTYSIPLFVNDACGSPPGYRLSALAVDTSSSSFQNRLYFACREKGGGAIVINHSADRGERWSAPLALTSPETAAGVEERIPGLAVNRDGVVAAAWIDGRSARGHHCEQIVLVAASADGGQTFGPPVRISSTPTCDDAIRAGARSPTGGDYFGLVATADGAFRLMWVEVRDTVKQLMTAVFRVER